LYGASNLGSMLGLLAYPVLVEPSFALQGPVIAGSVAFDLGAQSWLWAVGYILLIVLVLGCVAMVWPASGRPELAGIGAIEEPPPAEVPSAAAPLPEPVTQIKADAPPAAPRTTSGIKRGSKQRGRGSQKPAAPSTAVTAQAPAPAQTVAAPRRPYEITTWQRIRWILLAACPSSLMLGVTTYISTDISAIPLFWVIPLSLYLLSFILVFMRWPVLWTDMPHKIMLFLHPVFLLALVFTMIGIGGFNPIGSTILCMLAFFSTALVCHGELAVTRPPTKYLTEFYLWMSVGGMLGGTFNALFAPILFIGLLEFPLALVLAGLLRPRSAKDGWADSLVTTLFPGFVDWLGDKGDDIARNLRKQPAAQGTPARASRQGLPERGWLLNYSLDLILPILLALTFTFVLSNAMDERGWNWGEWRPHMEVLRENPIFVLWHKTLGLSGESAFRWGQVTFQVLVFGVPLFLCFLFFPRPLRFSLGIAGLLLANHLYRQNVERVVHLQGGFTRLDRVLHADRSYFGILKVREESLSSKTEDRGAYTYLMHGTTHHGLNYQRPEPLRRIATTYYHRFGPVGVIMEKLNWFPAARTDYTRDEKWKKDNKWNPYMSDARIVASMMLSAASPMPGALDPATAVFPVVVGSWSEPPYATIGLGTGTMASYGRPFQHVVFYEIDNQIRRYSLPEDGSTPYFNYLHDAKKRGARLEVIMGDARLSMSQEDPKLADFFPRRDHYYRAMVVDAFSSDAIPVHLITKESIAMYFSKLMKPREETGVDDKGKPVTKYFNGGVLLVHTSNRHVDLVSPVTDVAQSLGLKWRVGNDHNPRERSLPADATNPDLGRFTSEYVMIAWDER
ncbi:MAG: hypothetical protein L0Z62_27805, partial [Gemmataceae bacterium]|nr:hypothetical protein [Gemmataceae bacterium]